MFSSIMILELAWLVLVWWEALNMWRFQAKTKVQNNIIHDFLFADDCALNAGIQFEMQESMGLFSAACEDSSLTVSTKKTKVMYQPAPAAPYTEPNITVGG